MRRLKTTGGASLPGALGAFATIAVATPSVAAEWQMTPSSSVSSGYTGNPGFLPQGGDDELQSSAELGLLIDGGTERLKFSLAPRATFSNYRTDESLDRNNQFLAMNSSWASERVLWSGDVQTSRESTQDSELGTSGLVQTNNRREYVSVGAGPRVSISETLSAGVNLRWSDTDYVETNATGLADYVNNTASLYGTWAASERTRFTLSANGGRVESAMRDSRNTGASLGVSHELGPRWSWSASAGPSWAESEGSTRRGTLFSTDISRRGEKSQWSLGASRQLDPIGTGVLAQTELLTLSASRAITEHLSLTVAGQASRNEQLFDAAEFANRRVRYSSVIGSLRWQILRDWTLTLSFEERAQEITSSILNAGRADGYRAAVGIAWNGRTLTL